MTVNTAGTVVHMQLTLIHKTYMCIYMTLKDLSDTKRVYVPTLVLWTMHGIQCNSIAINILVCSMYFIGCAYHIIVLRP